MSDSSPVRIVRGRWIITDASTALAGGAVAIEGDRIVAVDDDQALAARYPQAAYLGGENYAVIPGLINAHHHSNGVTALQQGIADRLLELWLLSLAQRRRNSIYLSTLLSAGRLLRSGVTAVVDVHSGRGTPAQFQAGIQDALRAYDKAGMRVAYAAGMTEESFLVWGDDDGFLNSLPQEVRPFARKRLPEGDTLTPDDYMAIMEQLWRQYRDHPRISVWFGPPGPQWVSDAFLQRIAAQAEAFNTGIQTHLLESLSEKQHGPRSFGQPTLLHLRDLEVLSPRLSVAHGVWLTEKEIEVLAESGAHLSHNPSSNLRLRAGVAPLNALLGAGANVALGMDGTTLNDDEDMFTEMRLALNLHRTPQMKGPAPTVGDIWRLATSGGARLLQAGDYLGRIAPGYAADLVLLRLDRILWPWVAPEVDPHLLLLSRARAADVDTVLVGGEVALRDGQPLRFDWQDAGRTLAEELAATAPPDGAHELVKVMMPAIEAYYGAWPQPDLRPYAAFNSRN